MNVGVVEPTNAMANYSNVVAQVKELAPKANAADSGTAASNEKIIQMIQEMKSQINMMNVGLEFSTYGNNGEKIAVVVTDKESGEVIREIPSKELQRLYAKMREINGIIFNMEA